MKWESVLNFYVTVLLQARHYYQIIKRPMDLSVIRAKLNKRNSKHYNSPDQFVADVYLMFQNCAKFNYVSLVIFCWLNALLHHVTISFCLITARLWGGPSWPKSGGIFQLKAERSLPRQSVPRGWGRLGQRWVRWSIQICRGWFPLAREEGAVPQEEEEKTLSEV